MNNQSPISAIMMGPSRVGKTTLITALAEDANKFLSGTPVTMTAADEATRARLTSNRKQLDGELYAGEFDPGALSNTQSVTSYHLEVHAGNPGQGLDLEFMDFPGGLLKSPTTSPRDWERVGKFLESAIALIIPIDATVVMEALPQHDRAVPSILCIPEVADVARSWAKHRIERPREPALLILAPVKCESYFIDNGGRRDRADQLFRSVARAFYQDVIDVTRGEIDAIQPGSPKPNLTIRYAPIDTIGCVEVERAKWNPVDHPQDGDAPIELDVTYLVRTPARRSVVGAESILTPLVRQVVNAMKDRQQEATDTAQNDADLARHHLEDRGFFTRVWDWVARNEQGLKERVTATEHERELAKTRLAALEQAVERLASRPAGARERIMP